ncbi:MAG: hypothetical protein HC812_18710, partial [Leptolyngbya sp. RL_3_1]|nr:hypothetical protein [Leptolyngbya sp. RL_3_1]
MSNIVALPTTALATQPQARNDAHLCEMWLLKGNKRDRTRETYTSAINRLWDWMGRSGIDELRVVTAATLLDYVQSFPVNWSDATCNQQIAAIKSLWTFGHTLGYFPVNVAGILTLGQPQPVLPERILSRSEVMAAIDSEPFWPRQLLIQTLFGTGIRIAEALDLTWNDLGEINGKPRITVKDGKGGKA